MHIDKGKELIKNRGGVLSEHTAAVFGVGQETYYLLSVLYVYRLQVQEPVTNFFRNKLHKNSSFYAIPKFIYLFIFIYFRKNFAQAMPMRI